MKLSLVRHLAVFALSAGGFAIALACANLLAELSRSDGLVRYPAAERLAATRYRLDTLTRGHISQSGAYQTADGLPKVLGWYARWFGLGQARAQSAMGRCLTLTNIQEQFFFQHALAVTVCSQQERTLIFVNRSLMVP